MLMPSDLLDAPIIEDPVFCRCGVKRQLRKGVYFCLNCDSVSIAESANGIRVRTQQDVAFDATYKDLIDGWYKEGLGADPIFRVKDGKPETFEDVYGQIDKEI